MIFLMDLPPPIHGMSNVNKSMLDTFVKRNTGSAKIINTVPSYAAGFFGGKIWGGIKIFHTFQCLLQLIHTLIFTKNRILYRPINGGGGQIFDILYLSIARVFGVRIFIHHHSFNYLNKSSRIFKVLNRIAGNEARHIVLGERMQCLLKSLYGISEKNVHVLSNIAFFEERGSTRVELNHEIVIGYLSNICVDKGIVEFLEVCSLIEKSGLNFKAVIAGPFADEESEELVREADSKSSYIQYLGPLYGDDKKSFFKSLDVFVFPSRYKNEAEPLVLYEAAQFGAVCIGTKRGCMEAVLSSIGGRSVNEDENPAIVISQILRDLEGSGAYKKESREERIQLLSECKQKASDSLMKIMGLMVE